MGKKEITKASSIGHGEEISHAGSEADDEDGVTPYRKRRGKAYGSWESVLKKLLYGQVEEEAFYPEQQCCECGDDGVEMRCVECEVDQYFCVACANKIHERKSYFHMLLNITHYIQF